MTYEELGHFTFLFCRERQRNVRRIITHVHTTVVWLIKTRELRQRRRRRRRGQRLVQMSRPIQYANCSKIVLKLNMQLRRSIPNGNTKN